MDVLMPQPLSERLILAFHINGISHLSTLLQRYNSSKCPNSWLCTTNDCDGEALRFFSWFGVFTGGHHLSYVHQWCCLVWVQGEPLDHLFSHSHCHFRAHRARHHWALQAHGRWCKFPSVDSLCSIFRIKIPKKTRNSQKLWCDLICTSLFWYSCTGLLLFYDLLTVSQNSHFQEIWDQW